MTMQYFGRNVEEEGCAVIPVDGRYEYRNLVSDYKEAKKMAK